MTTFTNSFEGGTSGTTLTAGAGGNTGGTSGNFFDTVSIVASGTDTFDNTHAAHGTLANQIATGATSGAVFNAWNTSFGSGIGQVWFRQYLYLTANVAANCQVFSAFSAPAGSVCASVQVTTTGTLQFLNDAGTVIFTTTATIPLNQWFRIEGFVIGSATVGQVELKLFSTADATTPTETDTSAATQNTRGTMGDWRYGQVNARASVAARWQDDLGLSNTGYLGPAAVPTGGGPLVVTPPGLQSPMVLAVPLYPSQPAPPQQTPAPAPQLIPPGLQSPMSLTVPATPATQPPPQPPEGTPAPQPIPPGLQSPMVLAVPARFSVPPAPAQQPAPAPAPVPPGLLSPMSLGVPTRPATQPPPAPPVIAVASPPPLLTPPGLQSPMVLAEPLYPSQPAPPQLQPAPSPQLIPPGLLSPMSLGVPTRPATAAPPAAAVPPVPGFYALTPPGRLSPMSLGLGLYAPSPGPGVPPVVPVVAVVRAALAADYDGKSWWKKKWILRL